MLNLVNITQARNNLSDLVSQVVVSQTPAVIIRESQPQVVLVPYSKFQECGFSEHDNKTFSQKLLTIKGDWFSPFEYKNNRKQIAKRLKKNQL